ncbi:toll/interleukin-1 receptor domain-containing protein [Thermodesulfobacteriota bacterium]
MQPKRDVFLCHASEDKLRVVSPLAEAFEQSGVSYWLDAAQIRWGDSITGKVNEGLRLSRFVMVVFSAAFMSKKWPQRELNAALNQEASTGDVRILPLLVGTEDECKAIRVTYPLLHDKTFLKWEDGIPSIVDRLRERLSDEQTTPSPSQPSSPSGSVKVRMPKIQSKVTQRDKDRFLREAFEVVKAYFHAGAEEIHRLHPEIEVDVDEVHAHKFACNVYRSGSEVNRCKIWIGGLSSSDSIAYFAGPLMDINNDNSFNNLFSVDDSETDLGLHDTLGMGRGTDANFEGVLSPQKVAEYLWLQATEPLERQ